MNEEEEPLIQDASFGALTWLNVPITTHTADWLRTEAARREFTVAELVSEALAAYVAVSGNVKVPVPVSAASTPGADGIMIEARCNSCGGRHPVLIDPRHRSFWETRAVLTSCPEGSL